VLEQLATAPLWVDIEKKSVKMPTQLDTVHCIRRGAGHAGMDVSSPLYDSAAVVPGKDWRVTMEAQDERSVHSNSTPSQGALTGLRVIELADEQAEYCGLALAGLGAEVVKVEPPGGSPTRRISPFYEDREDPERSLFFWQYNRGKRSIMLDLRQQADRDQFRALIATADVLLEFTTRRERDC